MSNPPSSDASSGPTPEGEGRKADADQVAQVFATFTNESWQALAAPKGADDEDKSSSATAETAFRDELGLIAKAETLIVLAGSGSSRGLQQHGSAERKAPSMAALWAAVSERPEFAAVQGRLSHELIASKNLEHVLSEAQARQALGPADRDLDAFIAAAEGIILERCSFVDDDTDVRGHELFLRKVARRSTRVQRTQLFTTNYDLAFEAAARRTRFNVIDGFGYSGNAFDGGSFDLDFVRRRPNEPLALEPSVFHLLKLHGSVDWSADGATIRKVSGKSENPVLIYPSAAKYQLSYQQPYLEFMSRFQIALRQPDVGLIVVGYGFNDEHINAPIEAALRANVGLRAVFVTPGAKGAGRAESVVAIEDLITRGDRRLSLLAGSFDDLVRYLPDVPPQEERDAHAERFAQRPSRGQR